jgi:serine/threonine protein kinase
MALKVGRNDLVASEKPIYIYDKNVGADAVLSVKDQGLMALKEFQETYYTNGSSNVCLQGRRRYEFKEQIFKTQCCEIHKAYDYVNQQMIAIKQISPFDRRDVMFAVRSVINETKFQQRVGQKTSSVLGVRDFFVRQIEGYNAACIVMDLLPSNDLFDTYYPNSKDRKVMGAAGILDFAFKALELLGDMKKEGVLHCDIKPRNIAYSRDDGLKVFDFGLSKDLDANGEFHPKKEGLYQTMNYRCPAAIIKSPMSSDSDMWSLGCVLFELFTHKNLFYFSDYGKKDDMHTQYELFDLITRTLRKMPPEPTLPKAKLWFSFIDPCVICKNGEIKLEFKLKVKINRINEPKTIRERMLNAMQLKRKSTGGRKRKITDEDAEEKLIRLVERLVSYDIPSIEDAMLFCEA